MTTRESDTSSAQDGIPRGWRAYQLPGGVPLLVLLIPLAVIVLLLLQLTGRLSDGPGAEERARDEAESVARAIGLPVGGLERETQQVPCPAGGEAGSRVAEHVLRTPAATGGPAVLPEGGVSQLTTDTLDHFNLIGWGHRRYLAGDDRAVRAARADQAALVTLTASSVHIRVVVGPCAAEALPEPAPPYEAG